MRLSGTFLATASMVALGLLSLGCSDSGPGSSRADAGAGADSLMVIAVGQPGSVLNAAGTGIAKLVTEATAKTMRIRVTSGMDALVGAGDAELGVSASDSVYLSSHGLEQYQGHPQTKLRLALPGPPLILGFIVRAGSSLRSIEDLRGLRVPGEYPNTRPMFNDGKAMLRTAGMSWSDVDVVPVASFRDGIQAFIEGRADAVITSAGSGLTQQADASVGGVRFLSLPDREDLSSVMWNEEPGFHAVRVKAGSVVGVGVEKDVVLAGKDAYLTANVDTSPDNVYQVVKLLWERMSELESVHPIFAAWTHEVMANPDVTLPFHEGTVRFLREISKWSPAHEEAQRRLLASLPP